MPVKEYEFPPRTFAERKRNIAQVLWTVHLDGPFIDGSGRATAKLLEALKRRRVTISPAVVKTIVADLDHPGALYGHLLQRKINGKRTNRIALQVDPYSVPFPPNPWAADTSAKYQGAGDDEAVAVESGGEEFDDIGETYTRQALLSPPAPENENERTPTAHEIDVLDRLRALSANGAAEAADDEVEEVVEEEELVEEEAPAPAPSTAVDTLDPSPAGLLVDDPVEMPNVGAILDGLGLGAHPVSMSGSSGELLTSAIGLISQAMTVRLQEDAQRQQGTHLDVDRRIDERMAAYVALIERNAELEDKLRRSFAREGELVGLVRTLQSTLASLQRNGAPTG